MVIEGRDLFIERLNSLLAEKDLNPYVATEGKDEEFTAYTNDSSAALITHNNGISVYISTLLDPEGMNELVDDNPEGAEIKLWADILLAQIYLHLVVKELTGRNDSSVASLIGMMSARLKKNKYSRRETMRAGDIEITAVPSASILTIFIKPLDEEDNLWYNYCGRVD